MSYEPTWGLIIACYLFLAGLGGGAFLTSALLRRYCPQAVNMIRIGRVIAPIAVIIGLLPCLSHSWSPGSNQRTVTPGLRCVPRARGNLCFLGSWLYAVP